MLSPRNHERVSVALLGLGAAIIFLGYDIQLFFAESIIHSLHNIAPDSISNYAGYYGQAIHYLSFALFSLFTASLDGFLSSKKSFLIMVVLFMLYYIGFYHINKWYYYFTQILMGLGYALFNNAEGLYLAEHSSEKTLIANSGIETALAHTSLLSGGLFLFVFNYFFSNTVDKNSIYRNFSLSFVQIMYSGLLSFTALAGVIFIFLPIRQQPDSIAKKTNAEPYDLQGQCKKMGKVILHENMLLLAVTFLYQGFFNSFYLGVYTTALSFTSSLKDDIYLIPFYSLFIGIAEFLGFLIISPMMKLFPKHRLIVTMAIHLVCTYFGFLLINCTIPNEASIRPTIGENFVLKPNRWIICLTGFLLGLADYSITLARCVICQIAVPEARAEVFSLTRVYMCLAACSVLCIAPHLTVRLWTIIIVIGAALGVLTFVIVAKRTGRVIRPSDIKS